ncbi:penicillin-binding protein 2 [Deinococcus cavernae]|uniref:Penicillin-binding protein 2 n=1 Tax=Deinococcus cavernae TaxID=2320857 RepID=A0A418V9G6_9DEIO|nr:penicillin-binding protein 2 [Deinococcus cavernae]RJF72755.1 penicillin-binding protein 2 [Deinococcus cavernae]
MEIKIRNRSHIMQAVALLLFLSLVWAYAQLEWGLPNTVKRNVMQARGTIYAADGSVLARSVNGKRTYPQGHLAGQVLGMMGDTEGLEGLEAAYNRTLEVGEDVKLTVDPRTQASAEAALAEGVKAHKGEYGSVIVMETLTGRILAAASYPEFNPNNWRSYSAETRRNRPFLDVYEPGSTVKGLVVAAAMNDSLITPDTLYNTPMQRHVGGRWGSVIHDAVDHPATLNTKYVLRYSSNVGMSHIVEKFPATDMRNYLLNYGFGQDVQLPVLSTATGRLQNIRKWDDLVRVTSSFGQGMSSTTLQLAAAYNTLANDGLYISPRLVEGATPGERREVLKPATARKTRDMLEAVIEEGISHSAGLKGYALAGKTGTSQVVVGRTYSKDLYDSVFAGFFPADAPRVTVAVMVHGAKLDYHGSMLAAPIYKKIAAGLFSDWAAAPAASTP